MDRPIFVYGAEEIAHLRRRDATLAAAIDRIGPIERAVIPDLFTALVHAIVGQQISRKAHATVWDRMTAQYPAITPEVIDSATEAQLQSCGISFRKAAYIKDTAAAIVCGELDLQMLNDLPDDAVCKCLSQRKGIGVWTAEMLMLFSMQRRDVVSMGDLGILRGMCMLYRHRNITPALFAKYKRRYSPYGSTASLYLWAVAGGALDAPGGAASE